ncbi:hypothetical protein JZ751_017989 [Albula glossodonta]|uniref:Neurensin-2 n=1 Tax=Albula glossodonta TaxID=121402 RepID=A0A8T2PPW3_9TELE|nr:hypothetical protein JZ751_017989 [Albula glossodonta]
MSMAGFAELPCCPRCSGRSESGAQAFGVRSYLHLFYEDCAFFTPQDEEEEDRQSKGDPVSSGSWYSLLWKASLTAGLLLVVTGGVALSAGLLLPPQIEGFGDGDLLLVDEHAVEHNGMLTACRLAGGLLLGVGSTVLLAATERVRDDGTYRSSSASVGGHLGGRSPEAWAFPSAVSPIQPALPIAQAGTLSSSGIMGKPRSPLGPQPTLRPFSLTIQPLQSRRGRSYTVKESNGIKI